MPSGAARKKQLKAARQALSEKQPTLAEDSDEDVDSLRSCLHNATQQIQLLEKQLADQVKVCTGLQDNLNASQDLFNMPRTEILSLKAKNNDINHQLRIERQRYKRAGLKNGSMVSQIAFLKKADVISSNRLKGSANTIENLLKMNEDLQNKLSRSEITWSSQTKAIKSKLISSDTRLKDAQKEVSKLRKSYCRATQVKDHAVETAKAKVMKQKSVHHLAKKGVFTEASHINDIITAVLKTADITMAGSISRISIS